MKKRLFSALLALCIVLTALPLTGLTAFAEAVSGHFAYEVLSEEDKTCEITQYDFSAAEVEIPSQLDGYTVTGIRASAFSAARYYALTSITIPDSVISIEQGAFVNCDALENINVSESNPNFSSENGILFNKDKTELIQYPAGKADTTYAIPNTVTRIGDAAFGWCSTLTEILVPNSVTSIGISAFAMCEALESVNIPEGVTEIKEGTFLACGALKSVELPGSIASIGDLAFYGCTALESINIPAGVTSIGMGAFSNCHALKIIVFPNGLTSIGASALAQCQSLTSVTIPSSITSIGNQAFYGCTALESINVGDDNPNYSSMDGVLFNKDKTELLQYPAKKADAVYSIPNGVLHVGDGAFGGCSALERVVISNNVTSIGADAFRYCTSLASIVIPGSVTNIGDAAFYGCASLASLEIPASVTGIGSAALSGCTALEAITVAEENLHYSSADGILFDKAKTTLIKYPARKTDTTYTVPNSVTSIGGTAFEGCAALTLVTIPENVTSIAYDAFDGCTNLAIFGVPGSYAETFADAYDIPFSGYSYRVLSEADKTCEITDYIGSVAELVIPAELDGYTVTSIGEDAFYLCDSITSVIIPDSVTHIGEYAFSNCDALLNVTLPDSVTSIGDFAFFNSASFTSIAFGNGVTYIGENAFNACDSFADIRVSPGNPNYSSQDGVLFNKDKTTLVLYPHGRTDTTYVVPEGVTHIGDSAFAYCDALTGITFPDSVTSIGNRAFTGCSSLTSITIPGSVKSIGTRAFWSCALESVVLEEGVTHIGEQAFEGCDSLANITLPDSMERIEMGAFSDTAYVNNSANWENGVLYIGNHCIGTDAYAVDGTYAVKDGTKTIADYAFYSCFAMESVSIPESVLNIGESSFGASHALESINVNENNPNYSSVDGVLFNKDKTELILYPSGKTDSAYTIPNSVTSIDDEAFFGCDFTSVTIPDSVISIGDLAFASSYSLTEVTIGSGTTEISANAFSGCSALERFNVSDDNTSYSSEDGILFNKDKTELIKCPEGKALTTYVVPNSVTSIGDAAFQSCDSLWRIILPSGLTNIGDRAFAYCYDLTHINIPSGVTSIGESAFVGCDALPGITIPESVTSIGDYAFGAVSNDFIMYGASGSYAEAYAAENDISFSALTALEEPVLILTAGEADENGVVTVTLDYTQALNLGVLGVILQYDPTELRYIEGSAVSAYEDRDDCFYVLNENYADGAMYFSALGMTTLPAAMLLSLQFELLQPQAAVNAICYLATDDSLDSVDITPAVVYNSELTAIVGCTHPSVQETVLQPATCTEDGKKLVVCDVCGASKEVPIPATGHNYESVVTAPTCTEQGYTTYTCTVCGDSYTDNTVPATGHSFGDWVTATEPTCTNAGEQTRTCSACGATETQEVPATGHNYESVVTPPTCTEDGFTTHTCTACDDSYTDNTVPATGHSFGDWVTATEPTCTNAGEQTRTCSACGVTETQEVPATGHTPGEWVVTTEPTYTQEGERTQSCTVCGEVLATEAIEKLEGLFGDVNEDGKVDAVDARWVLQAAAGMRTLENATAADVNTDSKIDAVDARWILQAAAGMRAL